MIKSFIPLFTDFISQKVHKIVLIFTLIIVAIFDKLKAVFSIDYYFQGDYDEIKKDNFYVATYSFNFMGVSSS